MMDDARLIELEVGYSWGDPDVGVGAGIEEVKAFDSEGNPIELTEQEIKTISEDAKLAERIEDKAQDDYVDWMENH